MNIISQIILKLFHAGGLKPRDVPSGTSNLVSAVRRRYGQAHGLILFVRTECKGDTTRGKRKLKPGQKKAFPFPLMVSPLHSSSLPSHPHQARFYRCVLSFLFVSCIEYCFVPFTAAPLICGLAFRYRVSAVCFA